MRPPNANSFTIKYHGRMDGIISEALIGAPFDPSKGQQETIAGKYNALWDTGASRSVITQRVVNDGKLAPISITKVHTAAGETQSPVYLVSIGLPNNVWFFSQQVTVGQLAGNIDVLIGMDVINMGDFAITHSDGLTTFSFRCPSTSCVDFVGPPNGQEPGRNAPCWCGSGRKYKHCHG